jgi:DNA polymerase I
MLNIQAISPQHAKGWAFPVPAIDLYAEYMTIHNTEMSHKGGDSKLPGPSLIKACRRYRVPVVDADYKVEMRELAYTKSDHTPEEIAMLQDYCLDDDCWGTLRLFVAMRPEIDLLYAPIRGAFMMEIERIRWNGISFDTETYYRTVRSAPAIVAKMRLELNRKLGAEIYFHGVFKSRTVFRVMQQHGIPIPIDHKTGKYSCAGKLIKSMIETYPLLKDLYEYKRMIDAVKNLQLEIGADNRSRAWLNPFGQKTGRNNPSTNKYIFGLPHTMRSFIKPEKGRAIAQVDYGGQEIGIAAALSKDPNLIADYATGDPYKQFARVSLGVENPTKAQRQVYKACLLGQIYGIGAVSLARNLGITRAQAQSIIDQIHARYPVLMAWLERVCIKAAHGIPIVCTLNWSLAATGKPGEERTFKNFPMQGNGSEMMRLVIIRAGAAGLKLIGCAHDGFMIEDSIEGIERSVAKLQEIMRQASRDLLGGFEIRADCDPKKGDVVFYPERFVDEREREDGMAYWNWLMTLIAEAENAESEQPEDYRSGARGIASAGTGTDTPPSLEELRRRTAGQ